MCLNDDATFTSAENALTGVSPTRDVRGTNLDLVFSRSLSLNAQAAWASPSLSVPMDTYADPDPYSRPRYDNGIDSKIVIMGNSGTSISRRQRAAHSVPQASGKLVSSTATPRASSTPRTPPPPVAPSSSRKRST